MDMSFTPGSRHGQSQRLNKGATVRGVLISLAINTIPSFFLFEVCKLVFHTSDMTALIISIIPVMAYSLVEIIRRRRLDLMSGFMIVAIAAGIGVMLLSGNPRLYLLRESFFSIVIGVVYMVSLLFPRPMWFYVGRYFLTGNDPENMARFNERWHYPYFRFAMRLMTLVWGGLTLLAASIHIVSVLLLPVALVLLVGPILNTTLWVVLLGWTGWYVARMDRKLQKILKVEAISEVVGV